MRATHRPAECARCAHANLQNALSLAHGTMPKHSNCTQHVSTNQSNCRGCRGGTCSFQNISNKWPIRPFSFRPPSLAAALAANATVGRQFLSLCVCLPLRRLPHRSPALCVSQISVNTLARSLLPSFLLPNCTARATKISVSRAIVPWTFGLSDFCAHKYTQLD